MIMRMHMHMPAAATKQYCYRIQHKNERLKKLCQYIICLFCMDWNNYLVDDANDRMSKEETDGLEHEQKKETVVEGKRQKKERKINNNSKI